MDLTYRDAFGDYADVPSNLVATLSPDVSDPRVTIAIPTYRRPQYLAKVVQSAIDQDFSDSVEIVIVDNDNNEDSFRAIIASLPQQPARPIRYFVNRDNIGMFGNWNRCIELARGEWMTILNDDDLLLPKFLTRSFNALRKRPDADGIVCKKLHYRWGSGKISQTPLHRTLKWLAFRWRFDLDNLMKVVPRKLFFGNELENGCGFLFKKEVGVAMGGYQESEFPASDFFFYIRMCTKYNLYWLNEVLAYIGWGDNETLRKSTIIKSIGLANAYYISMTQNYVPREWSKLRAQLTANQILAYQTDGNVVFTPEELKFIADDVGEPLPPPSYGRIRRFRLFNGGY